MWLNGSGFIVPSRSFGPTCGFFNEITDMHLITIAMKKPSLMIMIALLLCHLGDVRGQAIELNGFTGYQLGGKARLYDGDFRIDNALNYGGKIAVGVAQDLFLEISYMRADTRGRLFPFTGEISDYLDFSSNYIHLGGLKQVEMGRITPFATVGLGLAVWAPKVSAYDTKTQFSATVGAGVKLWITEAVGIRLQGSMLLPLIYNGFGFGCGIGTGGSGCSGNLYTRITPFQGEFSGGLIIRLTSN
jgi:hypothetical protein